MCVYVYVRRRALASSREAPIALLFQTGCLQPLILTVIQRGDLSALPYRDQTVNLTRSALMTSLMV